MYSDAIKRLRQERKMTQQQLADALGVARTTIGNYENGIREPNFETCEALADIFNCRLSDIIEEAPAATGAPGKLEGLVKVLDSLPDEALDKVLDYVLLLAERYK